MAGIDYEAEYNNRARVPEYPDIFARWTRDAELYRAEALKAGRAELGLAYGDSARETLDVFSPEAAGRSPLALFIHGGWWRSLQPSMFSHMARGLNAAGLTVAVAGYDLCPQISIAGIIDQMRHACLFLWQRFEQRILVCGHSAGGHLAAAMTATDWQANYPKAPSDLVPAAYAVSGVFDLTPLLTVSMNQDLRLDPEDARGVSPLFWPVPGGRALDAVVGGLESSEFKRQSRTIVEAWSKAGVSARYEEVPGTNHFTVIDSLAEPGSAMARRVAELARAVSHNQ